MHLSEKKHCVSIFCWCVLFVVFVFFGPISLQEKKLNLSSYNNEIVKKFHKSGLLSQVFCQDYDGLELPGTKVYQFSGTSYSRLARVLSRINFLTGWKYFQIGRKDSIS